jgi:ABC-2 type transport system ATP-binding protein
MSAITTRQLVRHFGPDIKAVDGIDLDIPEGQVFGFLGQNGSGKTTTVRMLTTLLRPTSGEATVAGLDIRRHPAEIRKRVGVALQEVGLDDQQTGRELLTLQARLFGISSVDARRRVTELLEVVTLSDAADRRVSGYSGGMKRRLDLACALIHSPSIVFLDEPTTGLDPITRESVWRYVQELNRREGVTFFLTTQYLEEADRLADDIAIMDRGKVVAKGSPDELKASIGADAISLSFTDGASALARAEGVLRGFEGVEDIRMVDEQAVVYVRNGSQAVAALVRSLDDAGLPIASLRLTHPTLDDVFLKATGHMLEVSEPVPTTAGGAA